MKNSKVVGAVQRYTSNPSTRHLTGLVFAICLIAQFLCPAFAAEINPYIDPARLPTNGTISELGNCKITILHTYFWRDWMPIVSHPGPDRGSPLHMKVQLNLDNSKGDTDKFTFRAVIVDKNVQSYPITFNVLPNFLVLPETVTKSWGTLDIEARKSAAAKYNLMWNGELKAGEIRIVELYTADGPYMPVGSSIHVEITWTNQKGDLLIVKTTAKLIERTD